MAQGHSDHEDHPPAGSRESVAAARQTGAGANRTQLRILSVAVGLIIVVIVVGLVRNRQQNASPVTDHPKSVHSTATVSGGVITVTGGAPTLTIDLYEDGICSACQAFEGQYGQQIMKAVDEGRLRVRYHFMNFLNSKSASHNYSTRAAAAFDCVAAVPAAQAPKGLFMNFHTAMFGHGTQPAENGSADLTDTQIAQVAVTAGAPPSAAGCITAGTAIGRAEASAAAARATMDSLVPDNRWGTPSVTKDGVLLDLNSTDWLTKLLP